MQSVNVQKTPSAGVVVPHYIFAALSFLVLSICILLSAGFFSGHYFQPRLLALTHLAALGWGSMIIFGALYQFLPVLMHVPLYSEKLARITFCLLALGTVLLVTAFWNFSLGGLMHTAMTFICLAVILFCINVYKTATKSPQWSIESDLILTSCLWLLITVLLGSVLALNLTGAFLSHDHLVYLKVHAHTGMLGWFLLLIIGVSARLFPMFMLSHNANKKPLTASYYLINGGLAAFSIDLFFFAETVRIPVYAILIVAGIVMYAVFIRQNYLKRNRKISDSAMKQSLMAVILLSLPAAIGLFISFYSEVTSFMMQVYLLYGVSIFLGFITALILGQTFKTFPFIMWIHFYKDKIGKSDIPLPKELFSEKLLLWQMITYILAFILLIAGILLSSEFILFSGSCLLLITALLYNINLFKVLLKKGL